MEVFSTSRQGTRSGNGDASIDMGRLVKSIREKLDKLYSPSPECCIYKVPKKLKKINEEAYTPLRVSIGPLHHGKEGLEDMEEHKLRYFNDFMQRSGKSLEELVEIMKEKEGGIRKCYAETINLESETFLEIILVDAAFIIEFLLRCSSHDLITPNDLIFRKQWMKDDIVYDLLLLENQLPFFVLHYLFNIHLDINDCETMLDDFICLTVNFLGYVNIVPKFPPLENINPSRVNHFLDLLRSCLVPTEDSQASVPEEIRPSKVKQFIDFLRSQLIPRQSLQQTQQEFDIPSATELHKAGANIPSKVKQFIDFLRSLIPRQSLQQTEREFEFTPTATELHEAGVKFKVNSSKNLFHIKFSGNVLEMPHRKIYDSTECLLRNIIAYEQYHCDSKLMLDYAMVMDYLINTTKDVELLVQAKVIENWLGDNDDVDFICLTVNFLGYVNIVPKFPPLENINPSRVNHFLDLLRSCLVPTEDSQASVPEEIRPSKVKQFIDFLRSQLIPRQSLQQTQQEFDIPSATELHKAGANIPSKVKQFIDFLRSLIPRQSLQQTEREFEFTPTATELHEAGVKFKVNSSKNLFHIKFSGNVLEMPHRKIYDSTECLLRNIIAYEQYHCDSKLMLDYAMVMDYLINTTKDVELLVQAKVIENWLGDNDDVPNLFNRLGKGVLFDSDGCYFSKLHRELNDYCKIRKHKWKATLRHNYCNTPWRVLSIIVAAILLGLTFMQSLCSLITCHK